MQSNEQKIDYDNDINGNDNNDDGGHDNDDRIHLNMSAYVWH